MTPAEQSISSVKVGDRIIVKPGRVSRYTPIEPDEMVVTKVARKYFTARPPEDLGREGEWYDRQFEIATGRQRAKDPNYTTYLDRAYTPAGWQAKKVRDTIEEKLREHKIHSTGSDSTLSTHFMTDAEMAELLAFCDRVRVRRNAE